MTTDIEKDSSRSPSTPVQQARNSGFFRRSDSATLVPTPPRQPSPTLDAHGRPSQPPHAERSHSPDSSINYPLGSPVDQDLEAAMDPKPPMAAHTHSHHSHDGEKSMESPDMDDELTTEQAHEKKFYVGTLGPAEDPQNFAMWRKCLVVFVVGAAALCTTFASSAVRAASYAHSPGRC